MLELIALWGFLGGLFRALAGFLEYGSPRRKRNIPLALVITGFIGVVSTFAVFYFEMSLLSLADWKLAIVSILAGYVGADILNSLFEILRQKSFEGRGPC
jgi:fluoride ion exporter CrcB/FEX